MRWQKAGFLGDGFIVGGRLHPHNTVVIPNCVFKTSYLCPMYVCRGKMYKGQMALGVGWSCRAGTDWAGLETGRHQLRGARAESETHLGLVPPRHPSHHHTPRPGIQSEALHNNC